MYYANNLIAVCNTERMIVQGQLCWQPRLTNVRILAQLINDGSCPFLPVNEGVISAAQVVASVKPQEVHLKEHLPLW